MDAPKKHDLCQVAAVLGVRSIGMYVMTQPFHTVTLSFICLHTLQVISNPARAIKSCWVPYCHLCACTSQIGSDQARDWSIRHNRNATRATHGITR